MDRRTLIAVSLCVAFAAAVPAAAQDCSAAATTTFVCDQFTVAANTMLEAHTPNQGLAWIRQTGTNGITINAAADNARNVGAGDWNVYTNAATPAGAAVEVVTGATVFFTNASANTFVDLFGRASTTLLNGYQARFASNGTVSIIRYNGGTPTVITSTVVAVTLSTNITFFFSLKNASKEVWINGVNVLSTADNNINTTGIVALGMQSNVAGQVTVDKYFAATFAPTAVDRLECDAVQNAERTLIEWSTTREFQNLGFRVYRDDNGQRTRVTPGLIAGAAFFVAGASLPAGNTYRWIDSHSSGAKYWVEEIDLHGRSVWRGPIAARRGEIDERVAPSRTFVDLRQQDGVVTRTRLAPSVLSTTSAGRRRAADPSVGTSAKQFQLAAGDALKIALNDDGLYRVTNAELSAAGLDAQNVRLYIDGAEVPIAVDGDGILFFGRALDTPSTGTRIAWAVAGSGGARMTLTPSADAAPTAQRSFTATAERRDKMFFLTFLRNPDSDEFVGPIVSTDAAAPTGQKLQLRHIDRSATAAKLTITLQGGTDADHRVAVSINGHGVGEMSFNGKARPSNDFDIAVDLLVEGDNTVSLIAKNGDNDISAVVSAAVTYPHTFDADDDKLLAVVEGGRQTSIGGFTSSDVQLIDITYDRTPVRIQPLRVDHGTVTFTAPASGQRTILAVGVSHLARPASLTRNEPSSLHDSAGADEVIITHPSFVSALTPLVQLRESQGLTVSVVKIDDVYDEFSFGAKDPHAIRAFLRAATSWKKPPRYVLLTGDASFDARNFLGFGDFDLVPTKLVTSDLVDTASDTWFTDFDDDGAADIPIGRLPVRTLGDAQTEIDRIVAYESLAAPASKAIMLVSDADAALDFHSDAISLEQSIPTGFDIVDVDSSRSGAAAARQQILGGFGNAFLIDYIGHGSVETWSNDSLLSRADVTALSKGARPPIVIAMTCLNGYFHDVYTESLAEALLRAPNGAVAVWASTALTSPDSQLPVNAVLLRVLLTAPPDIRLGDAIVAAQKSAATPDLRRTFLLFGDPATRVQR
jgi:hypothetical protein